jgi:3',5'-cyclic AMP phosphodiesterase CpdA
MTRTATHTDPPGAEESLTFAHLTDPHLTTPDGASFAALANKRLLGYLSWRRRRRFLHRPEVLAALVEDLRGIGPDQIAVTGDLTQVGLPAECEHALRWLEGLAPPERVSLVPGNHDRYVAAPWAETIGRWGPYLASDPAAPPTDGEGFPALHVRGPVAFIGLSSARASAPLMATGWLGRRQREAFERLLVETAGRGLFRVVLIHHPPVPGSYKWRKRLTDGQIVTDLLARHGAGLVLHGHTHRLTVNRVPGPDGEAIPVVGLSSASAPGSCPERAARYSLWTVTRRDGRCALDYAGRVFDPASGRFRDDDWNPLAAA